MRHLVFGLACSALGIALVDLFVVTLPEISGNRALRQQSLDRWDADLEKLRSGPYPSVEQIEEIRSGSANAAEQSRLAQQFFYRGATRIGDYLVESANRGQPSAIRDALSELLHSLHAEILTRESLMERKLGLIFPSSTSRPLDDPAVQEDQTERALSLQFVLDTLHDHPEVALYDIALRRNRDDDRLLVEWRMDGPPEALIRCAEQFVAPSSRMPPREFAVWHLRRLEPTEWGFAHQGRVEPPCRFEGRFLLWNPKLDQQASAGAQS